MPDQDSADDVALLRGQRIIIVLATLELGGAERQAILLARYLAGEQGAEVEVWGYGERGRASELCEEHGIRWRSAPVPLPWSASRAAQLKRLAIFARSLRRARPDVILPFMFMPSVACGIVWRATGACLCIWNQRDEGRDRLGRWAEKLAVRFTPSFVANSGHGAQFMVRELGVRRELLHVIHNGVQLAPRAADRAAWRSRLEVDDDCFLACMVANLQVFKDHVTLLKAWRIVVDRLQALKRQSVLLLAGRFDGTQDSLKALADELELGGSVRFLGQVKDVAGLLGAVDVGVHSSVNEGCPNGVLECMAASLAVAGTDYSGIREAVGEQGYQFLAPPGDAQSLAERIIALALDREVRREAGAANRQRIESEFDPRNMCRKMLSLIVEGLRGESVPASQVSSGSILAENREAR
jgi:glycosyltransferase involved in cell wall biosynthesis